MNNKTIWMEKQNRPSLIVDDIVKKYPEVDPDFIYYTLLRRGVFKWFSIRRVLIRYKLNLKEIIRTMNRKKNKKEKGYIHGIEQCYKAIREMCHSERWTAPDNDRKSITFLYYQEGK